MRYVESTGTGKKRVRNTTCLGIYETELLLSWFGLEKHKAYTFKRKIWVSKSTENANLNLLIASRNSMFSLQCLGTQSLLRRSSMSPGEGEVFPVTDQLFCSTFTKNYSKFALCLTYT